MPDGYFSVIGELFKHLYNLEAIFNRSLDEHAMIEICVGLRWARYIGLPAPKTRKQLQSPMNRVQAEKARFEWE